MALNFSREYQFKFEFIFYWSKQVRANFFLSSISKRSFLSPSIVDNQFVERLENVPWNHECSNISVCAYKRQVFVSWRFRKISVAFTNDCRFFVVPNILGNASINSFRLERVLTCKLHSIVLRKYKIGLRLWYGSADHTCKNGEYIWKFFEFCRFNICEIVEVLNGTLIFALV